MQADFQTENQPSAFKPNQAENYTLKRKKYAYGVERSLITFTLIKSIVMINALKTWRGIKQKREWQGVSNLAKTEKNDLFRDSPIRPRQKLRADLPIAPSINHMYIGKTKTLNKKAKNYIRDCRSTLHERIEESGWVGEKGHVWFYVDAVVYMPDRRLRDAHNMFKLLMDVLQRVCFHDDYYAMPRVHSVEYDKINPRIELLIRPQTNADRKKALDMMEAI